MKEGAATVAQAVQPGPELGDARGLTNDTISQTLCARRGNIIMLFF